MPMPMPMPRPSPADTASATWARTVNHLAARVVGAEPAAVYRVHGKARLAPPVRALLTSDNGEGGVDGTGWRMASDVAEKLVEQGLHPDYLAALATFSALEPADLYEFAGIDRTTVGRRKAAGAVLPHEVAVKALQATELLAQANDVFGSPAPAAAWLTRPHPLLQGQTPLRRARTPWGLSKVQGMLAALRWGGVV